MSDFNIRTNDDQLFQVSPEIRKPLDLFLQEIDILFDTEQGQIFGQRSFGYQLEQLIWKTGLSEDSIESLATAQIKENCFSEKEFNWTLTVQIMKGSSKDIGVIDLSIRNRSDNALIAQPRFIFK